MKLHRGPNKSSNYKREKGVEDMSLDSLESKRKHDLIFYRKFSNKGTRRRIKDIGGAHNSD